MSSAQGAPMGPGQVIDAIIPARDEAPTVTGVVGACRAAAWVREVIVVDDGSVDATAALAVAAGAKVVAASHWDVSDGGHDPSGGAVATRPARRALAGMARRPVRALARILLPSQGSRAQVPGPWSAGARWRVAPRPPGAAPRPPGAAPRPPGAAPRPGETGGREAGSKAAAMAAGVAASDADAFLFVDGDLMGLTGAHLYGICRPFIEGVVEMSVGWADYGRWNPVVVRLPPTTGQRVVPRWVFEAVPLWRRQGYNMEIMLNEVIAEGRLRTAACTMAGVTGRTRRDKLGPQEGRRQTWQMFWTLMGLPMTGAVRWRTYWWYWRGLSLWPPVGGPGRSRGAAAPPGPHPVRPR